MAQPVGDARPASPARTLASKAATATFAGVAGTAMSVREAKELRKTRAGLGYGLTAYTMWGVFPIYFRALTHVSPWVILGHRILWSAVFLSVIVSLRREWPLLLPVVREQRNLLLLAAGGVLIAVNWLVFIHAVVTGQLLESSLGYFVDPLFSVALGMVFLHERLRRWQWVAVAIAGLAVANLTFRGERIPWIALSLAGSFGLYRTGSEKGGHQYAARAAGGDNGLAAGRSRGTDVFADKPAKSRPPRAAVFPRSHYGDTAAAFWGGAAAVAALNRWLPAIRRSHAPISGGDRSLPTAGSRQARQLRFVLGRHRHVCGGFSKTRTTQQVARPE